MPPDNRQSLGRRATDIVPRVIAEPTWHQVTREALRAALLTYTPSAWWRRALRTLLLAWLNVRLKKE